MEDRPRLYRFGVAWESRGKLAAESRAAEAKGYPHGVSTFDRSHRADATSASRREVERHFRVLQTGRNHHHWTVVLPKPLTEDTAELFNRLFGRERP